MDIGDETGRRPRGSDSVEGVGGWGGAGGDAFARRVNTERGTGLGGRGDASGHVRSAARRESS